MTLLRLGGFSSLCVFHRGLGSNDEAAGLSERSDRILYGFPHEVSPAEQMRRVAYFEGLIDFSSTFAPSGGSVQSITLKKRRYAFCQVEKQIWMVVGIVREQIKDVSSSEGGGGGGGGGVGGASNVSIFTSDNVADAALRGLMQRFWDSYCLFYGSVSRVLETPAAAKMIAHISDLKRRLRKVHNRRVALAANYEFSRGDEHLAATSEVHTVALSPGEEYRNGDIRRGENSTMTAETASSARKALGVLSAEEHVGGILLRCVERFSPISVLRRLIRSVMDFLIYYTDWSNLCAPFEGYGAVRSHNLTRRDQAPVELASYVKEFIAKMQRGEPSVQHVALAFDGILVAGQSHPSVPILFQYMRMHVFHAAHMATSKKTDKADSSSGGGLGSTTQAPVIVFEPDLRDYEISSLEVESNLERKISSPKLVAGGSSGVVNGGSVGRSLLKQTSGDSVSSPNERANSAASSSGVVHFIDGQLWSDAVDLKSLLLDLTERLCSDAVSLASVVRIIPPNEIDNTTGLPKWPLLVRCALRDAMQGSSVPRGIPLSPSSLSLFVNASVASPQMQESVNSPGSEKGGGPMSPTASAMMADPSGSPLALTATARVSINSIRGGSSSQRQPLHSSGNKPASLSIPALPAAANAMHCLRGAVTVDLSWPVLHLPYTSLRFLESLSPLVDISSFPDSNNSTDTTRNPDDDDTDTIRMAFQTAREINLKISASSGCFGPEVAPPSSVSHTTASVPAAISNTSVSATHSISGLFRAAMGRPLVVAEAVKPFPSTSSSTSSSSNHVPADPPRVFMPALFENPDKPPSHRLLWIQQGLVSVMTFIDAAALVEKNSQYKRPLDLDCTTALSLSKLLTNVSDVFLKLKRSHSSPPIDEGLGLSMDSRAIKTTQEGLEASRTYGMRLVKPEANAIDERINEPSEEHEASKSTAEAQSSKLSVPFRSLDVHGTRVSARRPSKTSSMSATASISTTLVTQASPVSSLEAAADDLGPHSLRSAVVSLQLASGGSADGTDENSTHFGSHISPHSGRHLIRQLIIANGLPDPIVHIRNPVDLPRLEQTSPWPVSEMHMLATATQGMAASRRTGHCYSIQSYDGPESAPSSNNNLSSLSLKRLDGTSESDLHAMLTSIKAAEKVMFTV